MSFYTSVFSRGDKIYRRGYSSSGKRFSDVVEYKPYLFVPSPTGEYKTLNGTSAGKIEFGSIREARDFVKEHGEIENFEFYGLTNFQYAFINDEYPDEIDYDPAFVSVVSIDIETPTNDGFPDPQIAPVPITNITLSKNGKIVVLGTKFYKSKKPNITYLMCKDEVDLLRKFLMIWNHEDWAPDIVTGWNIDHFDIPYIVNRIRNVLGESEMKTLSPWRMVNEREIVRGKGTRGGKSIDSRVDKIYELYGITSLDYIELYKKFSFKNQESYALNYIANVELGEEKLDYSEYGSLYDLYEKNYELFVDYNIHDVVLVDKLDDKLKMIEQVMALAYDAKVNYSDTMTTVRSWDIIIHNYLLKRGIVIQQGTRQHMTENLVGGYVKEPKIGMSKWVVSFDLNSLYPHLIMQYNISPETFVARTNNFPSIDELLSGKHSCSDRDSEDEGFCFTANGCVYKKVKQGFLPALMEKMYDDRVVYKEKMLQAKKDYEATKDHEYTKLIARYHNMQLAKKIQLNSAYGALGNEYFRWFSFNNAEAITTSGQLSIRWIEQKINSYLNKLLKTDRDYIVASDTDSIYVEMGPLVDQVLAGKDDKEVTKALDAFIEAKIQPFIDKCYQELADMMNAREQKMKMKRETIANKGIWKAKKMYILNAWNVEGVQYDKPQLKVQGIEAVRSSTPMVCRNNIKKALNLLMNSGEEDFQKFIAEFRDQFMELPFEEVAFPRSVNLNYFVFNKETGKTYPATYKLHDKSLPIQVRASLVYNDLVKRMGLQKKFESINSGDKIKFSYLKMPNPAMNNVIASPGPIPPEFGLDKYIDREMQFEKTFIEPLRSITDTIGWTTEKRYTLESFF